MMRPRSLSSDLPAPNTRSSQPGCLRATSAKASMSRSKPFIGVSRPAATIRRDERSARGAGSSATALGTRSTRVPAPSRSSRKARSSAVDSTDSASSFR